MGRLFYDSSTEADFEDRVLAHLQVAIGTKLGKGESFYLSWKDTGGVGNGRTAIWLHPAIPLRFKYFGGRAPSIDPEWIRRLLQDSYAGQGLRITVEPESAVPDRAAVGA